MLVVMTRILCNTFLSLCGFFIIKGLTKNTETKLSWKNVLLIIGASILTSLFTLSQYSIATPILTFIVNIILHKLLFDMSVYKSILINGVLFILMFVAELILSPLAFLFLEDVKVARSIPWIMILINFMIGIISWGLSMVKIINTIYARLMKKLDAVREERAVVFIILTILILSTIFSIIASIYSITPETLVCFAAIIIFVILFILYSKEQNEYISLNDQYDRLLEYVTEFETWIDNSELNKHEYKNDLAVLETKVKDPEIKKFINEKLTKKLEVDKEWNDSIKDLPNGGIKGLLYYKIVLAKNKKVALRIDVSQSVTKQLARIKKDQYQVLCRLLGIYLDNALEAAMLSKEKSMSIEIYELHKNINIVISNSFIGNLDLGKMSIKGYTTKGKGHGSGLYFARKIVKQNPIFTSDNQICNQYYVQRLVINSDDTSTNKKKKK